MPNIDALIERLENAATGVGDIPTPNQWRDCQDAAAALREQREEIARRFAIQGEMLQARAQRDAMAAALAQIHRYLLPDAVLLPDGRRFEFSNPDVERQMLRGLCEAIRDIPKSVSEHRGTERLLLEQAVKLLREIDRHGVLSMATQRGAGEFVRMYDALSV
jgi:hypothetical protein